MAKKKTSTAAGKKTTAGSKSDAIRAVFSAHPDATVKDVREKLKARGTEASVALINKIKYGRPAAGGKKPRRGKRGGAGTSKADAIRQQFAELGVDARPRDVIAALKRRRIVVTSAQVSMLRRTLSTNGAKRSAAVGAVSYDHLLAAKHLAQRLGGVDKARQALESYAKLTEA